MTLRTCPRGDLFPHVKCVTGFCEGINPYECGYYYVLPTSCRKLIDELFELRRGKRHERVKVAVVGR